MACSKEKKINILSWFVDHTGVVIAFDTVKRNTQNDFVF